MPENSQNDIINRIAELSADAATWTANEEDHRPSWAKTSPGALATVAITMDRAKPLEISEADPAGDIAHHLGASEVTEIGGLRHVGIWVGADSATTDKRNNHATQCLHELFTTVRDGDYIASDKERDQVRGLFATDTLPVIHGPCLITGLDRDGGVAPLDDNFHAWFAALLTDMRPSPQAVIERVLGALGIPPEEIGDVVVVLI
jgi:hypothetical protein